MASSTRTLVYAFPTENADVADAAVRTLATQTITVPETVGRVFRSARISVYCQDFCTATGATVGEMRVGCSVGGAAYTTVTETDDLTHSGENMGIVFEADFTAQFTANFGAGTTQTVQVQIYVDQTSGTTLGTRNACALLELTYDFDVTNTTFANTLIIPIDSNTGALGVTLAELGTNQGPYLTGASGIIKETNPVVTDWFIVFDGCENGNGTTTDLTVGTALDSEAQVNFGISERTFGSDRYTRYIIQRKAVVPTTTSLHAIRAVCGTASHHHLAARLFVTYTYDANSAAATHSLWIPFNVPFNGATTEADAQVYRIPVDIQEPGTIALVQSGVHLHWSLVGAMTTTNYFSLKVGAGSARTYTSSLASGSQCGTLALTQRIDSGGAAGAALTLARGLNYIDVKLWAGAQRAAAGWCGMLYLNYTSTGVASGTNGRWKHNHTIVKSIANTDWLVTDYFRKIAATALALIADDAYWLQCAGLRVNVAVNGTTVIPSQRYAAEVLSGEGRAGVADGWAEIGVQTLAPVAENGHYPSFQCSLDTWKQHPADPRLYRLDVERSRQFGVAAPRQSSDMAGIVTYHGITYAYTDTVSGYAGTGAVTVKIHDATSGEHLYTVTASAGGSYTVNVYDNTRPHFSEVREDGTHVGRSDDWTAT